MLIARRKSKSATFIALYQAEKTELAPASLTVGSEQGLKVFVTLDGKTRRHGIPGLAFP